MKIHWQNAEPRAEPLHGNNRNTSQNSSTDYIIQIHSYLRNTTSLHRISFQEVARSRCANDVSHALQSYWLGYDSVTCGGTVETYGDWFLGGRAGLEFNGHTHERLPWPVAPSLTLTEKKWLPQVVGWTFIKLQKIIGIFNLIARHTFLIFLFS